MERTLRTIFTHDHLGPSTHQQVGLYAGLVVEPEGSLWYLPNGERMNQRPDGGPTSWEGYIVTRDPHKSYREFAIEFQDTQLAYNKSSISVVGNALFDPANKGSSALFDVAQYGLVTQPSPPYSPLNQTGRITEQQVAGYILDLNNQVLPKAFVNTIFPGMGVPLTGKETVTKIQQDMSWRIQVPKGAGLNEGITYELRAPKNGNSIFVYTPDIHPGWVDPGNVLNPPGGNAATKATGAPFPQLVSSGQIGTYSMNYRNESVLARVASPAAAAAPTAASAAAPTAATIEIDGEFVSGTPTWVQNGKKALGVTVNPGDTVIWKALNGTHGVVFPTQAEAEAFLTFQQTGGSLPALAPIVVQGQNVWGTSPQPQGTLLAQATVKAGVKPGAGLTFFCSQHGPNMNGSLLVPGGTADDKTDLAYVFKSIERNASRIEQPAGSRDPDQPVALGVGRNRRRLRQRQADLAGGRQAGFRRRDQAR